MVQARQASNLFLATLVFTLTLSQAASSQLLPTYLQPCLSNSAADAKCSELYLHVQDPFVWIHGSKLFKIVLFSKDQATVEEGLNQLCGTGGGGDTELTQSSSFEIFTFSGAFTHSSIASSSSTQRTRMSSPTLTNSVSTGTSNTPGPESGKSRDIVPDSENTAPPQPLTSENSASQKHWTENSSMLLVWLAVVTHSANIL